MNSTTTMGAEDRGGTGTEAAGAIDTTRTAGTRVTEAAIDAEGADEAADDGAAAGLDPAGEAGAQVDDLHRRRALGLGGGVADGLGLEEERHVRQRGQADDDAHVRPRAAERV